MQKQHSLTNLVVIVLVVTSTVRCFTVPCKKLKRNHNNHGKTKIVYERSSSNGHYMSKQNAGTSSSTSSSSGFNSPRKKQQINPLNLFNHLNQIIKRSNSATTTFLNVGDTRNNAKIMGDFGSTESFSTDYIPLDITCDPFNYHPDCIDDDVPGYTGFDRESFLNLFIPTIAPFISFIAFDYVAEAYSMIVDMLESSKTWVAVDGGAYQGKILTPAINGLVVPAMALLFATLTSTTISTLRQRQVDVRSAINMEAGELRALECSIESFECNSFEQDLSRDYLIQYTSRILAECHPKLGSGEDVINPRRGMDSELNGFTSILNRAYGTAIIPAHIGDECYASIARLRLQRTNRISALQSVYPSLHWISLALLAIGECIAFLMETDQDLLVFLNAIQIKILWSMLVGTFVACFTVFFDLLSPFSGSYQISASVGQLHTIKLTLQASKQLSFNRIRRAKEEQENKELLEDQQDFLEMKVRRRKEIDFAQQNEFFNLMNAIEDEEDETIMKRTNPNTLLLVSNKNGKSTMSSSSNNKNRSKTTRNTGKTNTKNNSPTEEKQMNGTSSFNSLTFINGDEQTNDNSFS